IRALVFKSAVWGVPIGIFWHVNELSAHQTQIMVDALKQSGATLMTNTQLVNYLIAAQRNSGTTYYADSATGAPVDVRPTGASPQQSTLSGTSNSQGPMLTPAVVGNTTVALPDPALLNWKTDMAHSPSPGAVVTIGNGNTGICAPSGCTFNSTQLSTAINTLACGETLKMQNTVYIAPNGNLKFAQVCDSVHW